MVCRASAKQQAMATPPPSDSSADPDAGRCSTCRRPVPRGSRSGLCPACVAAAVAADLGLAPPGADASPVPGYRLLHILGEGGAGIVWAAEEQDLGRRRVALKLLKPGLAEGEMGARFEAEMAALALMDHPGIARVYATGKARDGRPFYAMERVEGDPVTAACDRLGLSPAERLQVFEKICRAVAHAHRQGIIHRDLKPSNILMGADREPKVIDFGVARATERLLTDRTLVTRDGQMVGTPAYMSPEQAAMRGELLDERSDVYSLGVVLYELMTGDTPVDRETLTHAPYDEVLRAVRTAKVERPSTRVAAGGTASEAHPISNRELRRCLREGVDTVAMRALAKVPAERYRSAAELADGVAAVREGRGRRTPGRGRGALALALAAVAAVAAVAVAAAVWWPRPGSVGVPPVAGPPEPARPAPLLPAERAVLDRPDDPQAWTALADALSASDPAGRAVALAEARRLAREDGDADTVAWCEARTRELFRLLDPGLADPLRITLGVGFEGDWNGGGRPAIANEWIDLLHARTSPKGAPLTGCLSYVESFPWDIARWSRLARECLREAHRRAAADDAGTGDWFRTALVLLAATDRPQELMARAAAALTDETGQAPDPWAEAHRFGALGAGELLGLSAGARHWLKQIADVEGALPPDHIDTLPEMPVGWYTLLLHRAELHQSAIEAMDGEVKKVVEERDPHLWRLLHEVRYEALVAVGMPEEAASIFSRAKEVGPHAGCPHALDPMPWMNASLWEPWFTGNRGRPSVRFPTGVQRFGGEIEFDLRGIIQLDGASLATRKFPQAVRGIEVFKAIRRAHLLLAAIDFDGAPDGTPVATLEIHFTDGGSERAELRLGRELGPFFVGTAGAGSPKPRPVWRGRQDIEGAPSGDAALYRWVWESPSPGREIATFDFVAAGNGPGLALFGISIE